jgi:NTE family protein
LTQQGIYEGTYLTKWLAEILEPRGVRTFNDLRYGDAGTALPPEQRYRLVVTASDVSTGRLRRLPWDYPALGYEPGNVPVVDAVRTSMSIPFTGTDGMSCRWPSRRCLTWVPAKGTIATSC